MLGINMYKFLKNLRKSLFDACLETHSRLGLLFCHYILRYKVTLEDFQTQYNYYANKDAEEPVNLLARFLRAFNDFMPGGVLPPVLLDIKYDVTKLISPPKFFFLLWLSPKLGLTFLKLKNAETEEAEKRKAMENEFAKDTSEIFASNVLVGMQKEEEREREQLLKTQEDALKAAKQAKVEAASRALLAEEKRRRAFVAPAWSGGPMGRMRNSDAMRSFSFESYLTNLVRECSETIDALMNGSAESHDTEAFIHRAFDRALTTSMRALGVILEERYAAQTTSAGTMYNAHTTAIPAERKRLISQYGVEMFFAMLKGILAKINSMPKPSRVDIQRLIALKDTVDARIQAIEELKKSGLADEESRQSYISLIEKLRKEHAELETLTLAAENANFLDKLTTLISFLLPLKNNPEFCQAKGSQFNKDILQAAEDRNFTMNEASEFAHTSIYADSNT